MSFVSVLHLRRPQGRAGAWCGWVSAQLGVRLLQEECAGQIRHRTGNAPEPRARAEPGSDVLSKRQP